MTDKSTRDDYLKHFAGDTEAGDRQKEALKQALDIRKFEIDLYWKRAAYFWTFIAATFAGYFLLQKEDAQLSFESTYVITCLGFVFSLAWYFVNRGSKAWQRNWEMHVDLLEDEVMGPLYKSGLNRYAYKFWDVTDAFPFSPSKINQILGLFVTVVWLFLMVRTIADADWSIRSHSLTSAVMSILTVVGVVLLVQKGRASKSDASVLIYHRIRKFDNVSRREDK